MIFLRWLLSALALIAVAYLVPGVHVAGFWTAVWVALLLGLLNAIVRPVLILLTLPVTILTLGLFTLVINAGILLFISAVTKGFTIDGFGPAILAALLLWAFGFIINVLAKKKA